MSRLDSLYYGIIMNMPVSYQATEEAAAFVLLIAILIFICLIPGPRSGRHSGPPNYPPHHPPF